MALQLLGAVRHGAGPGSVRDSDVATGLPIAACLCPASYVRCRQVSFVFSSLRLVWGEATGRALVILGAFDQDCSLYTRVGDPDRHSQPNRPCSSPAVGRILVFSSFFFPYQARHDTQCRVHTIVIEILMTTESFSLRNRYMLVRLFSLLHVTSVFYAFLVHSNPATCRREIGW